MTASLTTALVKLFAPTLNFQPPWPTSASGSICNYVIVWATPASPRNANHQFCPSSQSSLNLNPPRSTFPIAIVWLCWLFLQVQEMQFTNVTHLIHIAWNSTHLGLRLQLCNCSPSKEPRMIVNLAWTSTHLGLLLQLCDCARNARLSKMCWCTHRETKGVVRARLTDHHHHHHYYHHHCYHNCPCHCHQHHQIMTMDLWWDKRRCASSYHQQYHHFAWNLRTLTCLRKTPS